MPSLGAIDEKIRLNYFFYYMLSHIELLAIYQSRRYGWEKKDFNYYYIIYFCFRNKRFCVRYEVNLNYIERTEKKMYRTELLRFRGALPNLIRYRTNLRNLKKVL